MAWRTSGILSRRYRNRRRYILLFLLFICVWFGTQIISICQHLAAADEREPGHPRRGERIFIASIHWNNEAILRSHWNNAVVDLVQALGVDNVYVSIFESGSWDNSKGALRELDTNLDRLGVRRNITLSDVTHQDEISVPPGDEGWIDTPRGRRELRRIPYLARLRNLTLQPLKELAEQGITFDKILFLNDVVFTTQDVFNLLDTNDGSYAAACSLDFSKPPRYYDTFALRDSSGYEHVMQTWPYFRSSKSRNALLKMNPIPVTSCWNGIVAMDSLPFQSSVSPLRFRGTPDSLALTHVEGSECCLIHADNPLSKSKGVYLNPRVRVGYNGPAYTAVHPTRSWLSISEIALGLWENWWRRTFTTQWFKQTVIRRRVAGWKSERARVDQSREESGEFCLINEMQVLVSNGWAHV
ncbi:uncharacterized protein TRUGW13939_02154 [Talaromyces rugulosus]|uniref:Polysaccharide export protein n=1 Tax=Talaromyces rugulosus TaxID=121627 RepID=A0A7H8QML3_TALRU|nr:uncharacterized protein TRUGW13939_02154 [Talaromyces rugulosus]QKX55062.1 hypothetical protein TRUGW13939_02154 [Talaromyces rugulosus]